MKRKFSKEVRKQTDLSGFVQELADDTALVIERGLSWSDNLPGKIYTIRANSSVGFTLPNIPGFTCRGGAILFIGDNATITSQSYRQASNSIEVTLAFSDGLAHTVSILCIYE